MARSERLFVAAVAVFAVPAAVACNAIVGLSDYERVECSGGGVCFDAGTPDAPESRDAGPDARPDASGTKPVRWAHFKMPNYAHDGGPTKNVQSAATYSSITNGYLDTITGLAWEEPVSTAGHKSWEEAEQICASKKDGGKWRLPSRIELVTLLDLSRTPKIDPTFASTEQLQYWTSSEVRPFGVGGVRQRWTVDFSSGGLGKQDEDTGRAAVRCIQAQ